LSASSPTWTPGPNMSTGRIEMNAVILPNGKVLAEGGSVADEIPDTLGKTADLYDPMSSSFSSGGTASFSRTLSLTSPPNGNIAPPGYCMLFLLDSAGVPSKAQFIQLSPYTTTPPSGDHITRVRRDDPGGWVSQLRDEHLSRPVFVGLPVGLARDVHRAEPRERHVRHTRDLRRLADRDRRQWQL